MFSNCFEKKWRCHTIEIDIEIDRAHRVYDGGRGSDRPRTLIFRVLRWHDRSDILKGARQAYPVKCSQNNVTLLFFPDFSPATAIRRKAFVKVKVSFIVNSATCTIHTYRELKLRYSLTPWCIQITLNTNSRTQKYR